MLHTLAYTRQSCRGTTGQGIGCSMGHRTFNSVFASGTMRRIDPPRKQCGQKPAPGLAPHIMSVCMGPVPTEPMRMSKYVTVHPERLVALGTRAAAVP